MVFIFMLVEVPNVSRAWCQGFREAWDCLLMRLSMEEPPAKHLPRGLIPGPPNNSPLIKRLRSVHSAALPLCFFSFRHRHPDSMHYFRGQFCFCFAQMLLDPHMQGSDPNLWRGLDPNQTLWVLRDPRAVWSIWAHDVSEFSEECVAG